jgi:hypothetical protein
MPESEDFLESNTDRLIEAGLGGEACLDPELRESLRLRLTDELKIKTAQKSPFPEKALAWLTALGLLAVLAVLAQFSRLGARMFDDAVWSALALLLLVNIALTPIASIVIVARRRPHGQEN